MSPFGKGSLFIAGVAAAVVLIVSAPADTAPGPVGPVVSPPAADISYPDPDSSDFNFRGYLWPTDASRKITSSFAEYRSAHFHGGIDISTNGTTGHKVFAVQDGYLYRIRITPNGYGKMLYIRHPDGYLSTYAHLQSFTGRIAELARAEQYRAGSYEIDLIHDAPVVRIKKGELIAYTGDTGFGPPHLHFEIRDPEMNPVNPLLGNSFRTPDNIPPTISRFMVRPLTAGSSVNDGQGPKVYSRFPRKDGSYRIPERIRVSGEVGLAVETKDRSNGVGGRTGVYTMELLIDGRREFHSALNAVPIGKTKQIYIHYDLPMIVEGRGRFQKLYVERGNELPFYGGTPDDGGVIRTDRLPEGEHPFTVRCTDIFGNTSTLTGTIVVTHPPAILLADVSEGSITLINRSHTTLDAVSVQGRRQFAPSWSGHTLTGSRLEATGDTVLVPVDTAPYDILKISARSGGGSWSEPLFHTRRKESGPAHKLFVDHEVMGDDLKITMTTPGIFTDLPSATLTAGERAVPVAMTLTDVSTAVGHYALPSRNAEARTIRGEAEVNRHRVAAEDRVDLYSIPGDRAGAFASARGEFSVSYDSGAVFSPLHFRVATKEESGHTVYEFEPRDVLLNRGITVSLPVGREAAGKPGIYYRSNQGWVLLSASEGPAPGMISGTLVTMLGDVAVMHDGTAPTLGLLRVRSSGGKASVSFRYHDNLSGVDLEKSAVTIDGAVVIPEIDGEHRRVRYSGVERLKKGRHLVKIVLIDRVGNESATERWLTVR
jgi:hypothetical protein